MDNTRLTLDGDRICNVSVGEGIVIPVNAYKQRGGFRFYAIMGGSGR